jgi:formylmethanofuran dehydrogenase subunit E
MGAYSSVEKNFPERTIGPYTLDQFKEMALAFHGYPAPGLLIGGVMVAMAQSKLPPDTLFEALVETSKCLPDAVQLLTPCSTGNRWMKVLDLGRFAVTLYDKFTGEGWRVHIDEKRLEAWPEIRAWFLKLKPKKSQDTARLFREIGEAGESYLAVQPVQIHPSWLGKKESGSIAICPVCGEAYPEGHGAVCRGCADGEPFERSLRVL